MKIFTKILGILLIIISILFLISIYNLNILNTLYLSITTILTILLSGFIVFKLFREKTRKIPKIIFSILSVLLIIFYFIFYSYINNTTNFIKNITKNNIEYKNYNVIVYKNSNYNKINDLKNKKIGFLTNDYENSKEELSKKIKFNSEHFDNTNYLTNSLYNNVLDSISIEQSYLDIIIEDNKEYMNDKKIIYKYKVKVTNKKDLSKLDINKPFIIYISGSDSRKSVKEIARSDVNIISVINPKKHEILMVNTPRDYYVQLHGTTGDKDKLTHAGVYGINMSINTMQDLLDINIDRYIKVSFATVINGVDVIDGIDIYSDKAFTTRGEQKCTFKKGIQHVNGECALAFSRTRKIYATGDRHRGENQEQVLSKMIEKISNPKYITKFNDILKAIDGSFETNASYEEITSLIKNQIDNPKAWKISTYNLDGASSMGPTYTYVNAQNKTHIMIPDEKTVSKAKEKIKDMLKV